MIELGKRRGLGYVGNLVLGLVVLGMFFAGFTIFYGTVFSNYGVTNQYGNLNDTSGSAQGLRNLNGTLMNMSNNLRSSTSNQNTFIILLTGSFGAFLQAFNLIDITINDFVGGFGGQLTLLGISVPWFIAGVFILVLLFIVWHFLEVSMSRQF